MLNMVGSVNHDATALRSAFTDLIAQPADEHVLIVISDGQPVGDNADADLHAEIAKCGEPCTPDWLGLGGRYGTCQSVLSSFDWFDTCRISVQANWCGVAKGFASSIVVDPPLVLCRHYER